MAENATFMERTMNQFQTVRAKSKTSVARKARRKSPHVRPQQFNYPRWQSAFSEAALRRAWLSVEANKGGGQGETLAEFRDQLGDQLGQLQSELLNGRYRPKKVRQILVPKSSGDWRPITLWGIRDRVAQRAIYNYLQPVWEP